MPIGLLLDCLVSDALKAAAEVVIHPGQTLSVLEAAAEMLPRKMSQSPRRDSNSKGNIGALFNTDIVYQLM